MSLPEGWTDDMTFPLPPGVTVEKIVDYVLSASVSGAAFDAQIETLQSWGLPPGDAELARDRALGGAFRAGTTSPENQPSPEKDPVAYFSYVRCRSNPALISAIFPDAFPAEGL